MTDDIPLILPRRTGPHPRQHAPGRHASPLAENLDHPAALRPRPFHDADPDFALHLGEKLAAAQAQADALEKQYEEEKAELAGERLAQLDELLTATMLVARIAAGLGDVGMDEQMAERFERLLRHAAPDVADVRQGLAGSLDGEAEARAAAFDKLSWRVASLTTKARGMAAMLNTAYKVAETEEDTKIQGRIEQAIGDMRDSLGAPLTAVRE